jgi:hypothetical protein
MLHPAALKLDLSDRGPVDFRQADWFHSSYEGTNLQSNAAALKQVSGTIPTFPVAEEYDQGPGQSGPISVARVSREI